MGETEMMDKRYDVPVYVLAFLLGQYCSCDDTEVIKSGLENVKKILADNFVRVPPELMGSFQIIFYRSAEDAVFKALGVE